MLKYEKGSSLRSKEDHFPFGGDLSRLPSTAADCSNRLKMGQYRLAKIQGRLTSNWTSCCRQHLVPFDRQRHGRGVRAATA